MAGARPRDRGAQNDDRQMVIVLNTLGGTLQELNRLGEALEVLERARNIAEPRHNERQLVIVLNSLGGVLQQLERLEEAAADPGTRPRDRRRPQRPSGARHCVG